MTRRSSCDVCICRCRQSQLIINRLSLDFSALLFLVRGMAGQETARVFRDPDDLGGWGSMRYTNRRHSLGHDMCLYTHT
jgi:hypothetical protein